MRTPPSTPRASNGRSELAFLRGAVLVVAISAASGCTSFPSIPVDQCGNHVVESGEDCDSAGLVEGGFHCGAANTAQACRVLCDATAQCPTGWVCDDQGSVCRQPSGKFANVVSDLGVANGGVGLFNRVAGISAVELDGRPPSELAIQGGDAISADEDELFLAYFDAQAHPRSLRREVNRLKPGVSLASAPALGSNDSTVLPRDVLVLAPHPRLPSLLTLRGQSDGTTVPGMAGQWGGLSPGTLMAPSVKNDASGAFGFLTLFDGAKSRVAFDSLLSGPLPGYLIEAPGLAEMGLDLDPGDEVVARMAAGRLSTSIPEWLVYALRKPNPHGMTKRSEIHFAETLPTGQLFSFTLPVPPGLEVDENGGVFIGDLDGDGRNDVLIAAADGNTYATYGAADDPEVQHPRFSSIPSGVVDDAFSTSPFVIGAHPLALGFIDADAISDIVFPDHGVALSAGDDIGSVQSICPVIQSPAGYACGLHDSTLQAGELPHWSEAAVADLNDDGKLDVVTASTTAHLSVFFTDIVALGGTAQLTERDLPTGRPPKGIAIADLDGDLVGDVAFHVEHDGIDSMYVAFGRTSSGLEEPRKILDAGKILSLRAVSTQKDVDVLSVDGDEARWSLVSGRTDRQLSSPLVLPCLDKVGTGGVVPQVLGAGQFDARPGVDAAILHEDCLAPENSEKKDLLTLVSGTANGGLEAVLRGVVAPAACANTTFPGCQSLLAALRPPQLVLPTRAGWSKSALALRVDLAADGSDDLVLLGPDGDGAGRVLVARASATDPTRFEIASNERVAARLGTDDSVPGSAGVGDVDGDGRLDVVALAAGGTKLVVFSNDGTGLDVRHAHFIDLPQGAQSFALFDPMSGHHTSKVLLGTSDDVFIGDLDLSNGVKLASTGLGHGATHIVTADFDGDGLTDFAIASEDPCAGTSCFATKSVSRVLVYRSIAVNP